MDPARRQAEPRGRAAGGPRRDGNRRLGRYAEGRDESGGPIEVVDALRRELTERARRQHTDPLSFIANEGLFGDLARQPAFTEPYARALDSFRQAGVRQTVARAGR